MADATQAHQGQVPPPLVSSSSAAEPVPEPTLSQNQPFSSTVERPRHPLVAGVDQSLEGHLKDHYPSPIDNFTLLEASSAFATDLANVTELLVPPSSTKDSSSHKRNKTRPSS